MPEQSIHKESSLVSGEINEVLGAAPAWIMRWGSGLLLGIILLLIFLSGFIKYPDVIYGHAVMLPVTTPLDIMMQPGTAVKAIYVRDGDVVKKAQPLLLQAAAGEGHGNTITSPASGRVVLQQAIDTNNYFSQRTLLMSILPVRQQYYTTITFPAGGAGNVHIGQRVNIHLNNYARAEFGSICGKVLSKPLPAAGNTVTVAVQLDNGNITNYNKALEIYKGAAGQAEIITADKCLIQRIFSFLPGF